MKAPPPNVPAVNATSAVETPRARRAGQIAQGLVVGAMLVPAILQLLSLAAGIAPFNYQGF